MISLFQGIRAGVITKPLCETNLGKYRKEKNETLTAYMHKTLGRELFDRKMVELNFAITLLEYVVLVFDDLKLPLKIKRAEKPAMSDMSEFPPFTDY